MGVIKQLKQFITGKQIYPVTKSNAVYDNIAGRLDTLLQKYVGESDSLEVTDDLPRDADTLGGKEPSVFAKQTDLESEIVELNDRINDIVICEHLTVPVTLNANSYGSFDFTTTLADGYKELVTFGGAVNNAGLGILSVTNSKAVIRNFTDKTISSSFTIRHLMIRNL